MLMVGSTDSEMALCIFGLLRKPILLRRRSWVRLTVFGVWDGTLAHGRGFSFDGLIGSVLEFSKTVELVGNS